MDRNCAVTSLNLFIQISAGKNLYILCPLLGLSVKDSKIMTQLEEITMLRKIRKRSCDHLLSMCNGENKCFLHKPKLKLP